MADTIRVERQGGYTVLQNHILRSDMSLKAKGLLCVMLSLPEDWDYTIAGLASVCGTGRDAIRSAPAAHGYKSNNLCARGKKSWML